MGLDKHNRRQLHMQQIPIPEDYTYDLFKRAEDDESLQPQAQAIIDRECKRIKDYKIATYGTLDPTDKESRAGR